MRLRRIDSNRKVVECHLHNIVTHLCRIVGVVRQRLCVRNHNKYLIKRPRILKFHSPLQRTHIMSHMQFAGRTVTCQNNLFCHCHFPCQTYSCFIIHVLCDKFNFSFDNLRKVFQKNSRHCRVFSKTMPEAARRTVLRFQRNEARQSYTAASQPEKAPSVFPPASAPQCCAPQSYHPDSHSGIAAGKRNHRPRKQHGSRAEHRQNI